MRPLVTSTWCYRCEDYEDSMITDCCDHRYPMCYLTHHQDGTVTCYLCERHNR